MPSTQKSKRRGRKPGRPKKPAMKKVSAKGAYSKKVKNQMAFRRAPLVETKQRVASDTAQIVYGSVTTPTESVVPPLFNPKQPLNWRPVGGISAFNNIPVDPWLRMVQGLDEDQIIGKNYFSKFLKAKLEFRFPYNEVTGVDYTKQTDYYLNKMIDTHRKVYVVHGWVTNPLQAPIGVQPGAPMTKNRTEITQEMLNAHIGDAVRAYFDNGVDRLSFRERETSDIKILGYQRLKPNLNGTIVSQATPAHNSGMGGTAVTASHGAIPNVFITCNWGKINRKVQLTEGVGITDSTEPPAELGELKNFYPNDSWLPFCFIYNQDYRMAEVEEKSHADAGTLPINNQVLYPATAPTGEVTNAGIIQRIFYRYNMASWYTDS